MNNVVTTLAPSFLIGSSSFLQTTSKPMISQMGSKFSRIQGLFLADFIAGIRLYSQPQKVSFFPNIRRKIPNCKLEKSSKNNRCFCQVKVGLKLYSKCNRGSHSRKLAWCGTDVYIFHGLLAYRSCFKLRCKFCRCILRAQGCCAL